MYKGLNNSSIYGTGGGGGQQESIANGKLHFLFNISTYCTKICHGVEGGGGGLGAGS